MDGPTYTRVLSDMRLGEGFGLGGGGGSSSQTVPSRDGGEDAAERFGAYYAPGISTEYLPTAGLLWPMPITLDLPREALVGLTTVDGEWRVAPCVLDGVTTVLCCASPGITTRRSSASLNCRPHPRIRGVGQSPLLHFATRWCCITSLHPRPRAVWPARPRLIPPPPPGRVPQRHRRVDHHRCARK